MRVLWLSMNPGLYGVKGGNDSYNGGGWISSLQKLIENETAITLGLAFLTSKPLNNEQSGSVSYFPVYIPAPSALQKLRLYYGGYKNINRTLQISHIEQIIHEFKPDVIHLFGIESEMADILGKTSVPIVTHLQGLLSPCNNAFWPEGLNKSSFIWPFSINEWILRNGYIYAKKSIEVRSSHEHKLFKRLKYAMGRTEWDKQCTSLMAPTAKYFHVDEVLRPIFYENCGTWQPIEDRPLQVISTISNTIYKGLDLILKTAHLLKETSKNSFIWKVAGLSPNDKIIKYFEKCLHIKSCDVNVEYLGILSAEQLCEEELRSSVYVHPSYIDNSPNSLCEAQLLGMPCISTNVGGTSSLIEHEKDGILVPANAPFELAYYIKEIAARKEWSEELSKAGVMTASARHNRKKIVEELMDCYNSVINHHL